MDEIDLIRQIREAAEPPSPRSQAAARTALLEEIASATGGSRSTPCAKRPSRPLGRPRRTLAAALAVSALAVGLAIPILLAAGGDGVGPSAATALQQVAAVAAARSPESPGAGQYLYSRTTEGSMALSFRVGPEVAAEMNRQQRAHPRRPGIRQRAWWVFQPLERETWVAADGAGRERVLTDRPRFLSAQQRAAWVAAGRPALPAPGKASVRVVGRGGLFTADVGALPTEPAALRRLIESGRIPGFRFRSLSVRREPLATIGVLLSRSAASPALRAALFRAASDLPGIELLGTVRDGVGRKGIGVAHVRRGSRHVLIFDPNTSTLLGERDVLVAPDLAGIQASRGTVIAYADFLARRVVGSIDRPEHP